MHLSNMESTCNCDPLKKLLQNYFPTRFLLSGSHDLDKLHLFYKSSVMRLVERGGNRLLCRIDQDTFSSLHEILNVTKSSKTPEDTQSPPHGDMILSDKCDDFGAVTIDINIDLMKEQVIRWTVDKGWDQYSSHPCHNYLYKVEILMARGSSSESLSEYRKSLISQAASILLRKIGHQVDDTHYLTVQSANLPSNTVLIGGSPLNNEDTSENRVVLRVDVGSASGQGLNQVQDVLSKRLQEIKEISESRRLESLRLSSWATSLDNLTRATLHYELLYRPMEAEIHVGSLSEAGHMNHSALLIMYNYSRLLSILRRFSEQVDAGEYPNLPPIDEVDFSRIAEREEELRLVQLVMEWPRVMETAINFLRFHLNLVVIPKYLLALSRAFNNFYFQIVVLVPANASHNFPTMMARVYLMQALRRVFQDCLDILQISYANFSS